MASEQSSSGPALHEMTPATISLGLVPKPTSSTPFVPPSSNDWDTLFQPLFDELLTPPPSVDPSATAVIALITEVIASEPTESTGSPFSTIVDQDAPLPRGRVGGMVWGWGKTDGGKFGFECYSVSYSNGEEDGYCSKFGSLTILVPPQGLVRGLPKLKFEKYHLCSACEIGKSKKISHKPKSEDTNQEKLYLLHMDLCGPMRVKSVNGKKYILVIIDDYSRFIWVKCLRSKDEAPDFIIKFLKMIQVRLKVGISHETSVARSPQQNDGIERRNRTLIEAACTILIYAQAPLFLWAEAVAIACYTQNCSIVRLLYGKTPYEL
nr:retrovirus-related Pol polyprotein from transposon TNT 1-94 [Tanacetum cinerariifolium]